MEFMVIFFFAALAMGSAQDCSEERAEACVDNLLGSLLGDTSEEEVCSELRTSISCLRDATSECVSEKDMDEVEEGLQELEKLLKENCEQSEDKDDDDDDDEDKELQKCFEANEEYVYECIYEGTAQAMTALIQQDDVDENALQCTMYSMMADCFVERIGEKCGEKAASLAKTEMDDLPEEIAQACEAAGEINLQDIQLLDKKKRK